MDLTQKLNGVVVPSTASVQVTGFKERSFTLNMNFSDCTIADVIALATKPRVITWANSNRAKGEEHMASLPSVIEVKVQPVGTRGPVDIEGAYMSKAQSFDEAKLDAEIKRLEALKAGKKANKKQ